MVLLHESIFKEGKAIPLPASCDAGKNVSNHVVVSAILPCSGRYSGQIVHMLASLVIFRHYR
jgi:hypothetical protein